MRIFIHKIPTCRSAFPAVKRILYRCKFFFDALILSRRRRILKEEKRVSFMADKKNTEQPNEETRAAMAEAERLSRDPAAKRYTDVEEALSELKRSDDTPISGSNDFGAVILNFENARSRALKAVNAELIQMYWEVGEYLSNLCAKSSFGDKVIDEVAAYISKSAPTIKGFNRRGLYRMKQFYETYQNDEFVSALLTQISWTLSSLRQSETNHKTLFLPECSKNVNFRNKFGFDNPCKRRYNKRACFLKYPFCALRG